jgi:hypothetical protein
MQMGETDMPTIHLEITIDAAPETIWDAARDVGALHTRLVPGFVVATEMLPDCPVPTRRVTFAEGVTVDERIVSIDDERRRLVWTVVEIDHHNGALQIFPGPDGQGARVTWTADVLPAEIADRIAPMMQMGLERMKACFEG